MKKVATLSCALMLTVGMLGAVVGCSSPAADEEVVTSDGAPAVIPADHEGRFAEDGARGCYTCHGESDYGNPAMVTAVAMPDDHYVDGDPHTQKLDPVRDLCISCHAQA